MTIQSENIKYIASEVMDDVPEGGGALTATVIADGQMNNLFPDVNDVERIIGSFRLRKIGVAVQTATAEMFGGVRTFVSELPSDPNISYALFDTGATAFDRRADAANTAAAYLTKGPMWQGFLYGNHVRGSRLLKLLQKVDSRLPKIGETLCVVAYEGAGNEVEQYVRVTDIDVATTIFVDGSDNAGNDLTYTRWVVTCTLKDPLTADFTGHDPQRRDSDYSYAGGKARVRETSVSDALRYYGTQRLKTAASIGDRQITAQSQFMQLVPSARTETPLVMQSLNPTVTATLSAGARTVEVAQQALTWRREVTAENRSVTVVQTLVHQPAPGTTTISYMAQGEWYSLTDDGTGNLVASNGLGGGTVDFITNTISATLGALPDVGSSIIIVAGTPAHYEVRAGANANPASYAQIEIPLAHKPVVPNSAIFAWKNAAGADMTATADAYNEITGDATGYIDAIGGIAVLRVPYNKLPARDAEITAAYDWDDPDDPEDSAVKTITVTTTEQISDARYLPGSKVTLTVQTPDGGMNTLEAVVIGNTIKLRYGTSQNTPSGPAGSYMAYLKTLSGGWCVEPDQIVGSFNSGTGEISIVSSIPVKKAVGFTRTSGWVGETGTATVVTSSESGGTYQPPQVRYVTNEVPVTAREHTESHAIADIGVQIEITTSTDYVVPNSVQFMFAGGVFEDRSGVIVTNIDPATGSALPAGSIDYNSGIVRLTHYPVAPTAAPDVTSLLTRYGNWVTDQCYFRTAAAPLLPEGFQIVAVTETGDTINANGDADGLITGTYIRGTVQYAYGVISVEFGQMEGEEEEAEWVPIRVLPDSIKYNAVAYSYVPLDADILGIDAVRLPPDGRVPIYRPGNMIAVVHHDTITDTPVLDLHEHTCERLNTTAPFQFFAGLPGAELAGVEDANGDPVTGYTYTKATGIFTLPSIAGLPLPLKATISAYILDCGRPRIAWASLRDAEEQPVTEGFAIDRANGLILFAEIDDLELPLTVRHTIADFALATDVDINGTIKLNLPLTHDFPATETLVASCLMHGDRRARVSALWDQQTWDGTWVDHIVGNPATASLNTAAYPLVVTNAGCVTERWVIRWRTTTQIEIIGEHVGLVYSGDYSSDDIAPINPHSPLIAGQRQPYFVLPAAANPGGWSANNVVRFNTVAANAGMWVSRAIQPSAIPAGSGVDGFALHSPGNIDNIIAA